jgi:ABC-type bacteriocin/lantibiotic exporter with double-glycine peptidase domain
MVADDAGVAVSEQELAAALKTNEAGTNMAEIPQAMEGVGVRGGTFKQPATRADFEAIGADGKPAIVGVDVPGVGRHAVVVDKVENGNVFVRDPLPVGEGSSYSVPVNDFAQFVTKVVRF